MSDEELMSTAESAGITAILTHAAGILAALPVDRFEATMEARARELFHAPAVAFDDLSRHREDRVVALRRAANFARQFVGAIEAAHEHWRAAVKLTTDDAQTSEPVAFDAEGMPATGGHLVTLPSGKTVFQLDDDEPENVRPGGHVLYPKFRRPQSVPDGA